MHEHKPMNLQLFAEGGGGEGAAAPTAEAASAQSAQQPGAVTATNDRKAEFEKMIKGDWKGEFDSRVQQIISQRFKATKDLEAQVEAHKAFAPVLETIAAKYGADSKDAAAMLKAIEADDSYFEAEAAEKGISVEQLKYIRRVERENAELKRTAEERQARAQAEQTYAKWMDEANATKAMYDGFDFQAEVSNPETGQRFMRLLQSGVDVRTAYEVLHRDEIIGGAMQYTAQQVQQKTVNDIKARGMRPSENGGGGQGAAVLAKKDPASMTKAERAEWARRIANGERVSFSAT